MEPTTPVVGVPTQAMANPMQSVTMDPTVNDPTTQAAAQAAQREAVLQRQEALLNSEREATLQKRVEDELGRDWFVLPLDENGDPDYSSVMQTGGDPNDPNTVYRICSDVTVLKSSGPAKQAYSTAKAWSGQLWLIQQKHIDAAPRELINMLRRGQTYLKSHVDDLIKVIIMNIQVGAEDVGSGVAGIFAKQRKLAKYNPGQTLFERFPYECVVKGRVVQDNSGAEVVRYDLGVFDDMTPRELRLCCQALICLIIRGVNRSRRLRLANIKSDRQQRLNTTCPAFYKVNAYRKEIDALYNTVPPEFYERLDDFGEAKIQLYKNLGLAQQHFVYERKMTVLSGERTRDEDFVSPELLTEQADLPLAAGWSLLTIAAEFYQMAALSAARQCARKFHYESEVQMLIAHPEICISDFLRNVGNNMQFMDGDPMWRMQHNLSPNLETPFSANEAPVVYAACHLAMGTPRFKEEVAPPDMREQLQDPNSTLYIACNNLADSIRQNSAKYNFSRMAAKMELIQTAVWKDGRVAVKRIATPQERAEPLLKRPMLEKDLGNVNEEVMRNALRQGARPFMVNPATAEHVRVTQRVAESVRAAGADQMEEDTPEDADESVAPPLKMPTLKA